MSTPDSPPDSAPLPTPERALTEGRQLGFILERLCCQLIESHGRFQNTVLVGMQPRGILLGNRIHARLQERLGATVPYGKLDVTFHRDDFRQNTIRASETDIPFIIENKNVVLIDDVLYTGRTIRAGLDALLHFGRPARVELLVLVKRRFCREYPVDADYIGLSVDTLTGEHVKVRWRETDGADGVWLRPGTPTVVALPNPGALQTPGALPTAAAPPRFAGPDETPTPPTDANA